MQSLRDKARVLEGLGDKALEAFCEIIDESRRDLSRYRQQNPDFVAQSSARGLANWIHDRMWHHARRMFDTIRDANLHESGVNREIILRERYRVRLKRHHPPAEVTTYPTVAALDFMEQPDNQLVIRGLEQVRLIVGYIWDEDAQEMGRAVLSMRDGLDNVLWIHELAYASDTANSLPERLQPAAASVRSRLNLSDDDATGLISS